MSDAKKSNSDITSSGEKARKRKLYPSTRRLSKKKGSRERRRRLFSLERNSQNTDADVLATELPEENRLSQSDEQIPMSTSWEVTPTQQKEESAEGTISASSDGEKDNWVLEKVATPKKEEISFSSALNIVNMQHMFEEIKKIGHHADKREDCGIKYLQITGVKQIGLKTTLNVTCTMCNFRGEIRSQPKEVQEMDINYSAVAGTMFTGGSFAQMEEFLTAMNIPCMSKRQFLKSHDEIVNALIAAAEEEMIVAAEEEKQLAIERGDIVPQSGIPHIPVVTDGSWMKRSYRTGAFYSASGVGVIVGYHTKKVLYLGVRNKRCRICEGATRRKEPPRKHACFKNWDIGRACTAMESEAVLEGFKTSVETRGLIYSTVIADGDSSVHKKILDADPYKSEIRVKKIECTNHLLRNFCRKMREIAKKTKGPTRRAIENNILRMRSAIVRAAQYRRKEDISREEKMKNLCRDINNVPSHVFGEHAECDKISYFCDGKSKQNEKNMVPQLKSAGVYEQIKEKLQPLTTHAESLLCNYTNNPAECFNSVIVKYIGGKRINFSQRGSYTARCAAAVIQYNTKAVMSRLTKAMKKEPGIILLKMEKKRKERNEKNIKRRKETGTSTGMSQARKLMRAEEDEDYGPNASQPDINENTR
nr:PREDICTED: uncharacterized protein LOC105662118 [Megachile rotundata]XP_012137712.1 PREDICTED: uncharacterized protein LOC105662118 [Megachile rotundata]